MRDKWLANQRHPARHSSLVTRHFPIHPPPMNSPTTGSDLKDIHSEAFLRSLTRRQLKLSIQCAATFMVALLALPLLNYYAPELMATRLFGFTLTWLILGVLFFPFVWVVSFAFIRRSIALEEAEVREVEEGRRGAGAEAQGGKGEKEKEAP